jgi:hypothetical protein
LTDRVTVARCPGGDRFRLRTLRQGKRAEEADVVSIIVVGKL